MFHIAIRSISRQRCYHNCGVRLFNAATMEDELPARISVPVSRVNIKAIRSSGPGGQSVNKVSSCVEIRFPVNEANWLPDEVKERLIEQQKNRINKSGELIVTAQDERSQNLNKKLALSKLQSMVNEALIRPKERKMWVGIGEKGKEIRKEEKRHRSKIKSSRRVSKHSF